MFPFFFLSSLLAQVLVSQGGVDDGGAASVRAIMHWQYRTICRGQNSILHNLYDHLGPKTHDYISFYGLRSYGRLFDGGPVATSQVFSLMHRYCTVH
jgi:phospholipase D1/2